MEDKVFKEKIYGPYNEAWKILKIIQYAGPNNDDKKWKMFMKEIDRFIETYKDNTFARETLVRMMYDAGENIAAMNRGNESAIQKAE